MIWYSNFNEPEGQLARWLESLQEYDFSTSHYPGCKEQKLSTDSEAMYNVGESHEEVSVWIVTKGGPTTLNLIEKSLGEFQKQLSYSIVL